MNPAPQAAIGSHQIRAVYDNEVIRVYQAYNHDIADPALRHQRFVSPPFKMTRMTWIKPSFLWMMYRAGWGRKDDGQARILAIDISREGFDWAVANGCLSQRPDNMTEQDWAQHKRSSPVRIQWDPERDIHLQPLRHRSIQIGLSGDAVQRYVQEWTRHITDITELAHRIGDLVAQGDLAAAQTLLPTERPYLMTPRPSASA